MHCAIITDRNRLKEVICGQFTVTFPLVVKIYNPCGGMACGRPSWSPENGSSLLSSLSSSSSTVFSMNNSKVYIRY